MTLKDNGLIDNECENCAEREMTPAAAVIPVFMQTMRLHRRTIGRWAANIGLHRSQHRMLMHLNRNKSVHSQKQLAEHFDITPAAVATTLKRLESDGYIQRTKSANGSDSRNNEIRVTELGRITVAETEKYFNFVDSKAVENFTDDEIRTLIALLSKMQNNLNSIGEPSEFCGSDEKVERKTEI